MSSARTVPAMPRRAVHPWIATIALVPLAAATACADPAPGELCTLLAPPTGAVHVLETAADEPVAVGLAAPGVAVLEAAGDAFQPQARSLARALRALDRGDDPETVVAEHRSDALALDAAVDSHCAS